MTARAAGQLAQFAAVGALGFVIDASVLQALVGKAGLDPYSARAVSYLAAATATWWLNRRVTFRDAVGANPIRQWTRFLAANACGGAVNYAIYAALVGLWARASAEPALAVAIGSAAGLLINFQLSRRFVFYCNGLRGARWSAATPALSAKNVADAC